MVSLNWALRKMIQEYAYVNKIKYIINRFGVISGPWQFGSKIKDLSAYGFGNLLINQIKLYWIWRKRKSSKRCFTCNRFMWINYEQIKK